MASEWRKATLDKLGRIVTGKTPPSSIPGHFGGDIPFVTPTDFDGRRRRRQHALHRTLCAVAGEAGRGHRLRWGGVGRRRTPLYPDVTR